MITNRRTYYFHLAKLELGIAWVPELLEQTTQATGRSFRVMRCLHGPMHAIVFDMRFADDADMKGISEVWYSKLYEIDTIGKWFANVKQGNSEMWSFADVDTAAKISVTPENGLWGRITHRLAYQPYASGYDAAMTAAKQIVTKTQEHFQKALVLTQCYMGVSNIIALEADFEAVDQQMAFTESWNQWLKKNSLFGYFFDNIREGTSELWQTLN
jgi:hypothetical protein